MHEKDSVKISNANTNMKKLEINLSQVHISNLLVCSKCTIGISIAYSVIFAPVEYRISTQ